MQLNKSNWVFESLWDSFSSNFSWVSSVSSSIHLFLLLFIIEMWLFTWYDFWFWYSCKTLFWLSFLICRFFIFKSWSNGWLSNDNIWSRSTCELFFRIMLFLKKLYISSYWIYGSLTILTSTDSGLLLLHFMTIDFFSKLFSSFCSLLVDFNDEIIYFQIYKFLIKYK